MNVLPGNFAGLRTGSTRSSQLRLIRLICLVALASFLVWQVATRTLAAYFADARPETAIRLQSTEPVALLNLAEAKLAPLFDPTHQESPASELPTPQVINPSASSNAASVPDGISPQNHIPDSQILAEGRA